MTEQTRLCMGLLAAAAFSPGLAAGQDLTAILECREVSVFGGDAVALSEAARSQGFTCREHHRAGEISTECSGPGGRASAFGRGVKEFHRVRSADGTTTLAVVFNDPPARIEQVLAGARRDRPADALLATASVGQREDGVAELRCSVPGHRAGTGAIAGRVDFRGVQPVPAMRVCAAPVADVRRPHCVETASGQSDYLIERLPAGDYYVTAFALEKNPNRLFGAYTSTPARCQDRPGGATCPDQLRAVTVHPDDIRDGIDPATLMQTLPYPLRSETHAPIRPPR